MNIPLLIPRNNCNAPARVAVGVCCWPEGWPSTPAVTLELWHSGAMLHLRFTVDEETSAALVTDDGGEVWNDSCVETFIDFGDSEGAYYNIEVNCIGTLLMTCRRGRDRDVCPAPAEVLGSIVRRTSLPRKPFGERKLGEPWTLELDIPATAFFRSRISDFSGVKARANFYKCGDGLSRQHFLAWQPVRSLQPDFHRPQDFAPIIFQD